MPEETTNLIYRQIPKIMADIEAIGKDRKNTGQGYNFRGIDDVYNMIHSVLAKHKVFTVPTILSERTEERTAKSNSILFYRVLEIKYTFYAEDGSNLSAIVIGEGMDPGDKAANKAMSVAHKYALLQVFAIPTEEPKDPENDNHDIVNDKKKITGKNPEPTEIDAKARESNAKLHRQLVDLIKEMHKALALDDKQQASYLTRATAIRNDVGLLLKAIASLKEQYAEFQKQDRADLDRVANAGFTADEIAPVEQEIF